MVITVRKTQSTRLAVTGVLFPLVLGGCAVNSVDDYNLCALGYGAVGLGIGVASSGTGAVLAGAAGGGIAGYLICQDGSEAPADNSPQQAVAPMVAEPPPPKDSDGDGVIDQLDQCANTPNDVEVDEQGCAKPLVFDSLGLNFALDSAELAADADDILTPALVLMGKYPDARFEIIGHTDALGADAYNRALSLRRARALEQRLITLGASASRLEVSGQGEAAPVASNDTEEGRARNRRVELHLLQ